jgi:hypothetical protein
MTDESTTDDESGPYCPPLSTSEFAYVAFLGCWEGLGDRRMRSGTRTTRRCGTRRNTTKQP